MASSPIAQAFPIVRRALKILADREVSPQTGLLKSTLLQLDSTFSERNYGASSFLDFAEKLAQAGLVLLKHSGRSVMVELNPAFSDDGEAVAPKPRPADAEVQEAAAGDGDGEAPRPLRPMETAARRTRRQHRPQETLPRLGDNADGVRAAGVLMAAATGARWPMYLRNVKQILRAGSFDERRYGFGGLMDLLKACQRDGLVRIERDRRGGLRVFQGPNMARSTPVAAPDAAQPSSDVDVVEVTIEPDGSDTETIDVAPVSVVDTTAELLGRAKARKPRTRAATSRIGESDTPRNDLPGKPARAKRRRQRAREEESGIASCRC